MAPGGLGGSLQILAGKVGRVCKGSLPDSRGYGGPVSPLWWDTLQSFVWSRCVYKHGCSYCCTGLKHFVVERHQTFMKLREILKKRQEDKKLATRTPQCDH